MRTRRLGWLILVAVAVATLGGALAVRMKKPPQTTASTPPDVKLRPAAATVRSGPERSLLRMAIGAGVFVVLAIATVVVTAPSGGGPVTPRMVTTRSEGPHGMYTQVMVPGPVGRDDRVALTGDNGERVEVDVRHDLDQPSYDRAGELNVFYKVHIHNTGRVPVLALLDHDAWALDAGNKQYRADPGRSRMFEPNVDYDPMLEPGWEVDLTVGFEVPQTTRLTRLHVTLILGRARPAAEWNL